MGAISSGAHFVKADLHIHSYGVGGSYDVTDPQMNPENIVDTAISKGLSVIAITDHNEYQNSDIALKYITRSLYQLSMGQQQSILLAILLQSDSKRPLLIDQPEDNLDSEFIYKSIVRNLRRIKEHRQVIIVTHNANIAVLGDAELIIPLKSTNSRTVIIGRGSIDNEKTRSLCCEILEGEERAFKKRQKIYNI